MKVTVRWLVALSLGVMIIGTWFRPASGWAQPVPPPAPPASSAALTSVLPTPPAQPLSPATSPTPQAGPYHPLAGVVFALKGTSHIWVGDEQGVLHWAGDSRALAGRSVNWGTRAEVTLEELLPTPRGEPWLSAGIVKIGERIYVPKWEQGEPAPRLRHIESIMEMEFFGVNDSNYATLVLDQAAWERRYGFAVAGLTRIELSPGPGAEGPALIVPSQEVVRGRGEAESIAWLSGEVRNDGPGDSCGLAVIAFFFGPDSTIIAVGGMETKRQMPRGAVWPYKITLRHLPDYVHLEVRAASNTTTDCPARPLQVRNLTLRPDSVREEAIELKIDEEKNWWEWFVPTTYNHFTYNVGGMVVNDTGRPVINVRVSVWYVDKGGRVIDVIDPERGVQARSDRLDAGQATRFEADSESSRASSQVRNIAGVRVVAFGEPAAK